MKYESSKDIENALLQFNIKPKKRLGQHFMTDIDVLKEIVELAKIKKDEEIVEVGSGIGNLTYWLSKKAFKVYAVEFDRKMQQVLSGLQKERKNIYPVFADALREDLEKIIPVNQRIKLVANLPYNIAATLILDYLEKYSFFKEFIVTVQKEVGQRILSIPGKKNFGAYTLKVKCYAEGEFLKEIPSNAFFPEPKVSSWLIRIKRKKRSDEIGHKELFFKMVDAAFYQRRKIIINSLMNSNLFKKFGKNEWEEILRKVGISPKVRGETLSFLEYKNLFDELKKSL
ncbi:MAG: ribosomal RNA small subunit methyltransferase A [Actinomycetia bacterium]|nr:ribosomal RNA small subunit methyltransferase A [Actinomycetes bacterium]